MTIGIFIDESDKLKYHFSGRNSRGEFMGARLICLHDCFINVSTSQSVLNLDAVVFNPQGKFGSIKPINPGT